MKLFSFPELREKSPYELLKMKTELEELLYVKKRCLDIDHLKMLTHIYIALQIKRNQLQRGGDNEDHDIELNTKKGGKEDE